MIPGGFKLGMLREPLYNGIAIFMAMVLPALLGALVVAGVAYEAVSFFR